MTCPKTWLKEPKRLKILNFSQDKIVLTICPFVEFLFINFVGFYSATRVINESVASIFVEILCTFSE